MKNRPVPLYKNDTPTQGPQDPKDKFSAYSCMIPFARKIEQPWVSYSNVCPCDLQQSNVSGRGYTPCTFGINTAANEVPQYRPLVSNSGQPISSEFISNTNNMFPMSQYVPPQLDPRALIQVGYEWRT